MSKYICAYHRDGKIIKAGLASSFYSGDLPDNNVLLLECDDMPSVGAQYVEDGKIFDMPRKPDYPSFFDYSEKSWVWDEQKSWKRFRDERNSRLSACDWTQVPDAPVDHEAWAVYRQELRDLPDNTDDPLNPVWPTPPN